MSDDVAHAIDKFIKKQKGEPKRWMSTAKRWAQHGFKIQESRGVNYKKQWEIWAIQPYATLFRLYGFYEEGTGKTVFIVPSHTMKHGQHMNDDDKGAAEFAQLVMNTPGSFRKVLDE